MSIAAASTPGTSLQSGEPASRAAVPRASAVLPPRFGQPPTGGRDAVPGTRENTTLTPTHPDRTRRPVPAHQPDFNIPIIPIATVPTTTTTIPTTTTTIPTTTTTVPTTTTTVPPARPDCVVVDHRNDHHDISEHGGDPDGEISYALLLTAPCSATGTIMATPSAGCGHHRTTTAIRRRPQDAQPPSHTH